MTNATPAQAEPVRDTAGARPGNAPGHEAAVPEDPCASASGGARGTIVRRFARTGGDASWNRPRKAAGRDRRAVPRRASPNSWCASCRTCRSASPSGDRDSFAELPRLLARDRAEFRGAAAGDLEAEAAMRARWRSIC